MNGTVRGATPVALALLGLSVVAGRVACQDKGGVTGIVVDAERGTPLVSADVTVFALGDSTPVATGITQEHGRFLLLGISPGRYFARAVTLGHAPSTVDTFTVAAGRTTDLGVVRLDVAPLVIDSVKVVTERSAVTYEADRTGYNVDAMGVVAGGSVSDALMDIPEIEVGIDGEVSVRGRSPRIYVNGRPAPFDGQSLAMFLEQFPAELIQRIEVIHDPGPSFAAEGSGGIVNIVLKQGADLGSTTSLYVTGSTRGQRGVGAQFMRQKGPVVLQGTARLNGSDVTSSSFDLRQNLLAQPTTFTRQDGGSRSSSLGGGGTVGARWTATEHTQVGFNARVARSGNDADGLTTTTWLDELQTPISAYDRRSASTGHDLSGSIQATFRHAWEERRHVLSADVTWQRGSNVRSQSLAALTRGPAGTSLLLPPELTYDDTRHASTTTRASVDYVRPWGKSGRLSVGYRANLEKSEDNRVLRQVEDTLSAPGGVETLDAYVHTQRLNSAYVSVSRTLGRFSASGGVRLEHTGITFEVPGFGTFDDGYTDLFPSASVMYRSQSGKRLRASYSRRVSRPGASVLNPQNRSTDPLNRSVGNPDVEPTFTHSLSFDAGTTIGKTTVALAPYFAWVVNSWAPITTVDSLGISTRIYENVAGERSYGLSLLVGTRIRKKWSANVSVSGRRQVRNAGNLSARYSGTSTLWSGRATVVGRVTSSLAVTGAFRYTPPIQLPQGRSSSRKGADFGVHYQLLERRASVRLSLVDPFNLARRSSTSTGDLSYVQIARSYRSSRSASFSVSYVLGG